MDSETRNKISCGVRFAAAAKRKARGQNPAGETALKRNVIDALKRAFPGRCKPIRLNSGSTSHFVRGCEKGTPDLLLLLEGGQCLWVELKTDERGSKLSKAQEAWHVEAWKLGHAVLVARSVEEVLAVVRDRLAQREGRAA